MKLPNLDELSDDKAWEVGKLLVKRILEESYTDGIFDLTTDYSTNAIAAGQFASNVRDRKGKRLMFDYEISEQGGEYFTEYTMADREQAKEVDGEVEMNESDSADAMERIVGRLADDIEFNEKFSPQLKEVKHRGFSGDEAYLYSEYLIDLAIGFGERLEAIIDTKK